MLLDATQAFGERLTRERLFRWHAALFPAGAGRNNPVTAGAWRNEAGTDASRLGIVGGEECTFEAPPAYRRRSGDASILQWFERVQYLDPVLRAVAHIWFVTIHPFDDGNGRIARAIADMALVAIGGRDQNASTACRHDAPRAERERQIWRNAERELDITPWLLWFLGCLRSGPRRAPRRRSIRQSYVKASVWESLADASR